MNSDPKHKLDSGPTGQVFQRYRVLEKIGKGGMGEVFLAHDTTLDRKVSLKFLSPEIQNQPEARRRFLREARAAAAIDHPYVCKIYDAGEIDGKVFIGMEFVDGPTLQQRIREGHLELSEILRIAEQTAEALAKAHEIGIVHRDLKPSNIMLTREGHVKVMDFGLAKRFSLPEGDETFSTMTNTGGLVGTPAYMSPEQARGQELDPRSDIFSFGILLYEMLTEENPFRRGTAIASATAVITETAPPVWSRRSDCPTLLVDAVTRMLSKDPDQRLQSAKDFLEILRQLKTAQSSHLDSVTLSGPLTGPSGSLTPETRRTGLAVLPFVNMSPNPENEYFSDGITEEIISRLSRSGSLKLISRTSVMRYKSTEKDLRTIGHELGVGNILEGSVRHAGNRVRISSSLIDVETDRQLWSEVYDREITDIFQVQSEVSQRIASELQANLPSASQYSFARRDPVNVEAYHLYLKGRFFLNKFTSEGIQRAIGFFREALESDPVYALAYAGLSTCYVNAGHYGFSPSQEAFPKAQAAAERALELNESLSEAHASVGFVKLFGWCWDEADESLNRAIELNPSFGEAHLLYSWYLVAMNRWDDAMLSARRALEVDPLSAFANVNVAWIHMIQGAYDAAIEQFEKALELDPGSLHARTLMGLSFLGRGEREKAIEILEEWSWTKPLLGWAYALGGRTEEARAILKEVTGPSQRKVNSPTQIASLCFLLDEDEQGIEWLETAYREHDTQLVHFNTYFVVGDKFSDAKVQEIFARMERPLPAAPLSR